MVKILKYRALGLSMPRETVTETTNIAKGKVKSRATVQKVTIGNII